VNAPDIELSDGESLMIDDGAELVYRQITAHLKTPTGQVATHAFTGESGVGKPSYARASRVTAQESRDWHTRNANSASLGVWALAVDEVTRADRWVIDDGLVPPQEGERRSPGHCFLDVRGLERVRLKSLRVTLWNAAMDRGEIPTAETTAEGELDLSAVRNEPAEPATTDTH
jgi:hypothetical protein